MPTISYDGQSFIIDGRRVWLVSGAIHYTRVPRELWRSRIRAAKQAGLNCIETYCFWNVHETQPGVFNFEGDADVRAFVETIAAEGMMCILRPGPYICSEWDFGGLPAWLHRVEGLKVREANGPFLEACARYFGAIVDQVKDLQITVDSKSPVKGINGLPGGPIVMMQAENEWFCHNDDQADRYLRELVRYLRESGCTVPINVCNNLWQRVEGTIDTWNAKEHLAGDLRQLRVVQPEAPRIMTEYWPGWFDGWNKSHDRSGGVQWNLYRLGQILASGAQYNLYMFHGGTNFGFYGGRTVGRPDNFITTSYDFDAPLKEAGGRGEKYLAIKRISTFASQFAQTLANLDPREPHVAVALTDSDHPLSVFHQAGPQGQVIFLLRGPNDKTAQTQLMLPNGTTLPVPLGRDRVAWVALDVNLAGVATLSYTNLRPWAFVDRQMLVLFGPAGAEGWISINGSAWRVTVPAAGSKDPLVERHEDITLVVLNEDQVDAAYVTPTGLVVGAAALDENDQPLPLAGWASATTIAASGETKRAALKPHKRPTAPRLEHWQHASVDEYLDGTSPRFRAIDGAMSHEQLRNDYGYGWYRIRARGKAAKALAPQAGDRLHVFRKGKLEALIGVGPGADLGPVNLNLAGETVILADNLGRFNYGWRLQDPRGLYGDIHDVKPVRLGKPQVAAGLSPDPFELRGFWNGLRRGERVPADAWVWKIKGNKRAMILDIRGLPARVMVLVNNKPVAMYDSDQSAGYSQIVLEPGEHLRGGTNELRLALFGKVEGKLDPLQFVTLYESAANLTENAEWAFAPWAVPGADAFGRGKTGNQPVWHRAEFRVGSTAEPLWLEPNGLSKGQLYLNGRNVGRYFVATAGGKAVPPQERYYLPEPWLRTDGPNELLLFDEHGKSPAKCRLVYDPIGPYGD